MPRMWRPTLARIQAQTAPMHKLVIELSIAIVLTLSAIIASATGVNASDVMVMGAFARASATPVAKAGAAYFTVMNHGEAADRLVAVTSPAASRVQLHLTRMDGDVMRMEPVDRLEIPPGGKVELRPGGFHLMLTGLVAPLKEGDTFEVVLQFQNAGDVKVTIPVGSPSAGEHDHGETGG